MRAASFYQPESPRLRDGFLEPPLIIDSLGALEMGVLSDGGRGVLSGRGLTAVHTSLPSRSFDLARRALAEWEQRFRRQPQLIKILSADDIERCSDQGKLGILLGFQNPSCIDDNVDNLYRLYAAGARVIQLSSESRNLPGNGCSEESAIGLSDFGVAAVETMNELGMVVDFSRCKEETSRYGIQLSRKAPAFTHTSCGALHDHPHAKSDELLRTMAERGGVIGIHPGDHHSPEKHLDHVTHAVKIAGIDHVGIASFSGDWSPRSRVSFLAVARGLQRRGYRSKEIEKLIGGNWNRYLRQAI